MLQGISMLDDLQIRPRYAEGLMYLEELYADAGQRGAALENLKKAAGMFQEMGMDYWLTQVRKILDTMLP